MRGGLLSGGSSAAARARPQERGASGPARKLSGARRPPRRFVAARCRDCRNNEGRLNPIRKSEGTEEPAESTSSKGTNAEKDLLVDGALALLRFYRQGISPLLPNSCRFIPSCSNYSIQAYQEFGFAKGSLLTAWRILRCNPLYPAKATFTYDPPRWPPSF